MLIDERFIDMIDNTAEEYSKEQTQAEGPLISGRMQGVFWKNNVMAMCVYPRTDDENKKLHGSLETFDIMDRTEGTGSEYRLFGHGGSEAGGERGEKEA